MLISFRFGNHRSFRDEQELSLLLPTAERLARTEIPAWSEGWSARVEPVAGIYGANASGKSNVVNALRFMRSAVQDSYRRWESDGGIPAEPFLLNEEMERQPSSYEAEFVLSDEIRYQYGFRLDSVKIVEEWLYAYPHGRRQVLFERDMSENESFHFGKHLPGRNRTIAELTRRNCLFLTVAAANKHDILGQLHHWFLRSLRFASQANRRRRSDQTVDMVENPAWVDRVVDLIRFADLGISGVEVERLGELEGFVDAANELAFYENANPIGEFYRTVFNRLERRQVLLRHRARGQNEVSISFDLESDGARAWFALAGSLLEVLDRGDILCIDELDANLHPHLSAEVVRMFQDPELNPKMAQLIFTTHDTTLLGNLVGEQPLRRGQVWFTEKDANGASGLVPLTDFSPRKLENIERGYLQGRYGAVPFLDMEQVRKATTARSTPQEIEPPAVPPSG